MCIDDILLCVCVCVNNLQTTSDTMCVCVSMCCIEGILCLCVWAWATWRYLNRIDAVGVERRSGARQVRVRLRARYPNILKT